MLLIQSPNNRGSGMVAIPKKQSLHIYVWHLSAKILDMEKYLEHPNFSILGPCSRLAVYVYALQMLVEIGFFNVFHAEKLKKKEKV